MMKKLLFSIKILLVAGLLVASTQSCTKLDEEVYSDLTGDKLFEDPENLIYAFGVAYTNFYDLIGNKFGVVGMDAGTDLLCVPQRGGDWFDGGEWHRWHRLTLATTETYVERWWNILYYGVNTCNRLIFQFESIEDIDTRPAIAELRALRALYYWSPIDIYGNVPIMTDFDVPADFKPVTDDRIDVYEFIEEELLAVKNDLSKETGLAYFGRMNYYVAQMVLAKLYINAAVYTGTPQWGKALAACDTIIESGKFFLEADYFNNFRENATTSPEYILGVPFDQVNAPGFEVHLFTLHYNLSSKYSFQENVWNGICAQEAFYYSFEEDDVRREGLLEGQQYDLEGNEIEDPSYEKFDPSNPGFLDPDGAPLNLTPEINMLEPNCLRQAGTRIAKYPFIEESDRFTGNDVPIFRYADVLLMKAEILLRTGGGGENLVNEVRARAGVDPIGGLTMETLLAERGRELYAEGHRRSDMIRFGAFLDPRWEKDEVSSEHSKLWPIPQNQINANANLRQNPGY